MSNELRVLVQWEQIIHKILGLINRFPKSVRMIFSNRLGNLAFDVLEQIIQSQYSKKDLQFETLEGINMNLTKIRVMLRIAVDEQWMSVGQCMDLMKEIDELGKGIYAWKKNSKPI